jgi:hypothetical protein
LKRQIFFKKGCQESAPIISVVVRVDFLSAGSNMYAHTFYSRMYLGHVGPYSIGPSGLRVYQFVGTQEEKKYAICQVWFHSIGSALEEV